MVTTPMSSLEDNTATLAWPPPFVIRRSKRARHVRLTIHPDKGLEIVLPMRVNAAEAMQFLNQKRAWVERHAELLHPNNRQQAAAQYDIPSTIELPAIHQTWACQIVASSQPARLIQKPQTLQFTGPSTNIQPYVPALKVWLRKQAMLSLGPWIRQLSQQHNLPFNRLSFRFQRGRWGSCSSDNNISLNVKLLFLPLESVQYVLIHELCHTMHLNHSADFWNTVKRLEPNYQAIDKRIHAMERQVPLWL